MSFLSSILIAFSMSADAFAAAISKGVALKKPRLRDAMRIGLVFGSIETLTPIIGWALGLAANPLIESIDHWIAFGILCLVGGKMLLEAALGDGDKPKKERHGMGLLALTALGTSIDALAVGVTLAFMEVNIWLMAAMIGSATFVMTTLGVMTGHYIGLKAGRIAELLGGLCLIGIGCAIVAQHMGWMPG
jgi:putative Mn2+ efflux pump MntP